MGKKHKEKNTKIIQTSKNNLKIYWYNKILNMELGKEQIERKEEQLLWEEKIKMYWTYLTEAAK